MSTDDIGRGISTRLVEIVVAVLIFALGALVVFDSQRLGARWGSDGPEAGYFPFYIGLILCVCALALLAFGVVGKIQGPKVFVTWTALRRVMQVLVPAALYVLGVQLVGIYIASVAYIVFFMVWLGRYSIWLSSAIGLGVMVAFYWTFERWFKVQLYKGLWDVLGYFGL